MAPPYFELAPVAMVAVDSRLRVHTANAAARELFDLALSPGETRLLAELAAPRSREALDAFVTELRVHASHDARLHLSTSGSETLMRVEGRQLEVEEGPELLLSFTDLSEREQLETGLSERLEFERMVLDIIAGFGQRKFSELEAGIDSGLERFARFFGANRASLFVFSGDKVSNTNEWCLDAEDSQRALIQNLPSEAFGYYMTFLERDAVVLTETIEDLPPVEAAREIAWSEAHGFRSLLFVPLFRHGQLDATVGFYGPVGETVRWPRQFVGMLRFVGHIFTTILELEHRARQRDALETELHRARRLESVGLLAGGVAHDFNNLLLVILGQAELAQFDVQHAAVEEALEQILSAGRRAATLTRQLLAFGRRQVIQLEAVDLGALVTDMQLLLRQLLPANIDFEIEREANAGTVEVDRSQIEQVVLNLCVNARDAMPEGGQLRVNIANAWLSEAEALASPQARAGTFVQLSVQDTGTGIPPEVIEQIFEPFFTTKDQGKGTGLGLSVVHGVIAQHQGFMMLSSILGQGTTMQIYLPRVDKAAARRESVQVDARGGSETILHVEDDAQVRELVAKVLERAGYRVLAAADGDVAEALLDAREWDIDLALFDVVVPGRPVAVLHAKLGELYPSALALYTTGYAPQGPHTNFVLDEGVELLTKPFTQTQPLTRIRELLDKRDEASAPE